MKLNTQMDLIKLVVICGLFLAAVRAESQESTETFTLMVKFESGFRPLPEVLKMAESEALKTLLKKFPQFDAKERPSFSMNPNSGNRFLTLTYGMRPGSPYWWCFFDRNLRLRKIETGVASIQ